MANTSKMTPALVYVASLLWFPLSFFGGPSLNVVAGILAYWWRRDCDPMARTHYNFIIKGMWLGLLWTGLAALPFLYVIFSRAFTSEVVEKILPYAGLITIAQFIWSAGRDIIGLRYFNKNLAHPRPKTWGW